MSMDRFVNPTEFMSLALPLLAAGEADALAQAISRRWTKRQVCELLADRDVDVRRTIAISLGLIGDRRCACCLAKALHDEDAQVVQMAEHGLWSIWFRDGDPVASGPFREGFALMGRGAYHEAITCFEAACRMDPDFAEAYDQCSIAHFFLEQWDAAIVDAQAAIARMPMHFGAMAGLGHSYAAAGRLREAGEAYRRALAVHPGLTEVREALNRLDLRAAACRCDAPARRC